MSYCDYVISRHEWRPKSITDGQGAMLRSSGEQLVKPRFVRLMRALEEAELSEQAHAEVSPRRPPAFRHFEQHVVAQQLRSDRNRRPRDDAGGPGNSAPPWRNQVRVLPAVSLCVLSVFAATALTIAGARLMAISPAEPGQGSPAVRTDQTEGAGAIARSPGDPLSGIESRGAAGGASVTKSAGPAEKPAPAPSIVDGMEEVAPARPTSAAEPEQASSAPSTAGATVPDHQSSYDTAYENGYALQRQQRYADALTSYRIALELKPRAAHVLYNMGVVMSELGRLGEAAAAFERAAVLEGNNPYTFYDWGWTLERAGAVDAAREKYRVAAAIGGDTSAATNARKRLAVLQQ